MAAKKEKSKEPARLPPPYVASGVNTIAKGVSAYKTFCYKGELYKPPQAPETSGVSDGGTRSRQSSRGPSATSSATVQQSKSTVSKGLNAVKQGGTAASFVGAGGVFVCDILGRVLKQNKDDLSKPVDENLVKAIVEHCKKKIQYKEAIDNFLKFCETAHTVDLPEGASKCMTWDKLRERSVSELRKLAADIDKHHKNVNITTVTTASVGTVAGAVTFATILAPFTFGLSVAVGAAAVGAAAGLTALGASLTEIGLTKSTCSKAQECVDADGKLTKVLYSRIDDIDKSARELKLSAEKLDSWSRLEIARTVFVSIGGAGNVISSSTSLARGAMMLNPGVRSLAKELAKVHKADWVAKFGSKASGRTFSAAKGLAKQTPKLASNSAHAFGGVLTGLGLFLDIYSLVTTSIDISKGSVSAAGKALRDKADKLEGEVDQIDNLIEELKKVSADIDEQMKHGEDLNITTVTTDNGVGTLVILAMIFVILAVIFVTLVMILLLSLRSWYSCHY